MEVQAKWDEMCEAWVKEDWQRLEEVGRQVQDLINRGQISTVAKRNDLGRGFNEVLAKAGIAFIRDRFNGSNDGA